MESCEVMESLKSCEIMELRVETKIFLYKLSPPPYMIHVETPTGDL